MPVVRISFLSLNIACGFSADFRTAAMRAQQAAFIAAQLPDVVALQEVDMGLPRSGGGDTGAQSLGSLTSRGALLYGRGSYVDVNGSPSLAATSYSVGNSLWVSSDFQVLEHWNLDLNYLDPWPRCAIIAHIRGRGQDLVVAATHLTSGGDGVAVAKRREQMGQILAFGVDVVLGDMNAFGAELEDVSDIDLVTPGGCVDQVWCSRPSAGVLVPTLGVSDHPYAAFAQMISPV